jgi:hypothetical protein
MTTTPRHPGALALQRLAVGETAGVGDREHVAGCADCQAAGARFHEQQRTFEREVSFERFAAGVGRATREQARRPASTGRTWVVAAVCGALAGGLALWVAGGGPIGAVPSNRIKGAAALEVVVAEAPGGLQRLAAGGAGAEPLGPEDRVRLGIVPGSWRFALVLSIDEAGAVTPVHAEAGRSLPLSGASPQRLPGSLAFTGQGLERLVVVLSDRPLALDDVVTALRRRFEEAHGDLDRLAPLDVPGEQFQRTFRKR